jgi:hypothetical protein
VLEGRVVPSITTLGGDVLNVRTDTAAEQKTSLLRITVDETPAGAST